ncbi:RNA-guided endonuclease InsQ/TnpB family protein [Streptomyces sp. NRRL S-378]|uniref:RNA-guided endonuclease InsQ/TnpB family protein n=1 Tax=Streptomyces sp. NRRL S-378 TaxID=1463904 RepID=UPI00068B0BAA|nr:RNA-guided endonuclease TnpB family protein [Streptomyces sp. NRRL S-378]
MTEIKRAFRFALDPTPAQTEFLQRYANASRCAFNFAHAFMLAHHHNWHRGRNTLIAAGMDKAEATKKAPRVKMPGRDRAQAFWRDTRGQGFVGPLREGAERAGAYVWWEGVNNRAYYTAFEDAATAWKNYLDSAAGRRAGERVGLPRFKAKGRCRESFRLVHNTKKPEIRFIEPRRLRIPGGGGQPAFTVRLHQRASRLIALIEAGKAVITSVTVARAGHRWYASVLCTVDQAIPDQPTCRQRQAGRIGVDLGVKSLLALTDPLHLTPGTPAATLVGNPRHYDNIARKLARAQRQMARRHVKGARQQSKGFQEARDRVARLQAQLAARRVTGLHLISKRLVQQYSEIALETLNTKGMTRSAKGTVDRPGRNVRAKAGLNRAILDASFRELNRQIEYKARWHGVQVARVPTFFPSSRTCSTCGWTNTTQTLKDRTFHCESCTMILDRDTNAARNIKKHAVPVQ